MARRTCVTGALAAYALASLHCLFGMVVSLANLSTPMLVGPRLATSILSLVYGSFVGGVVMLGMWSQIGRTALEPPAAG